MYEILQIAIAPIAYLIIFLFIFKLLKKFYYKSDFDFFRFPERLRPIYFVWPIALVSLIYLGFLLVPGKIIFPTLNNHDFTLNSISLIIGATIVAPILEEITFRGIILNRVSEKSNFITGLLVSGLLFGLIHLSNGAMDLVSGIQLVLSGTFVGILFGLVAYYYQTIRASIILHAGYNFLSSLLPIDYHIQHDWPIQYLLGTKNRILVGGRYGTDASLISMISYLLIAIVFIILIKKSKLSRIK